MNLSDISNKLDALLKMALKWQQTNHLPAIERDIMLEKLRALYIQVVEYSTEDQNSEQINLQIKELEESLPDGLEREPSIEIEIDPKIEEVDLHQHFVQSEPEEVRTPSLLMELDSDSELEEESSSDSESESTPESEPEIVTIFGQMISQQMKDNFVKELFWRDEIFFENEVEKFDRMTSFDQALIYIGEKYNWRAESDVAEQFIDLLDKKFE